MSNSKLLEQATPTRVPQVVKIYKEAARRLGMTVRILDPEYGYLFEVTDGKRLVRLLGGRSPLNDAVAARLCEDKFYTNVILRRSIYRTPESVRCLNADYFQLEKYEGKTGIDPGLQFADRIGYPVVVKPNRKSHGRDVGVVHDEAELRAAVERIWRTDYIALVQEKVGGRDYRFDFLNGEYLVGYARKPILLTGDGEHTICELLDGQNLKFISDPLWLTPERDPIWRRRVTDRGWDESTVLDSGVEINFGTDILNLNNWAIAEIVPELPQEWLKYCLGIGKAMNLNHFGVDIKVNGIESDPETAVVIEVNSSPLLVQLYRMGEQEAAVAGYMKVLQAIFERQR